MKKYRFLYEYKQCKKAFVKPKFHWFFGRWRRETNLPVWRRGNIICLCKHNQRDEVWDFGRLVECKWNDLGKKKHPILSRLFKPMYVLPMWLSFYYFNSDIVYKTKWSDSDFRYEFPAHITLVFFGLCISVTAYIPQADKEDWMCQDDYWESLLTYRYFNGDLKKTNATMGYWNHPGGKGFKFRFQPRFLIRKKEKEELGNIQVDCYLKIKEIYDSDHTDDHNIIED